MPAASIAANREEPRGAEVQQFGCDIDSHLFAALRDNRRQGGIGRSRLPKQGRCKVIFERDDSHELHRFE
jgi:hypothetical protein